MSVELKLGERLEVLREEKRAASVIEMITPQGRLVISEPMHGLGRLPVKKNDMLNMSVFRGSGILSFTATAERVFTERGLTFIEVEIRSKVSRHQRRNYVRFDTMLPMTALPLYTANAEHLSDKEAVGMLAARRLAGTPNSEDILSCTTLDISGGGVQFICKIELPRGTISDCGILLKDGTKAEASMRVLRSEYDLNEKQYTMCAKFIGIQETLRERIIKYIFNEQLRQRRRGGS
jgi:c-di-GMP-binding flagellar brake protein YcgR